MVLRSLVAGAIAAAGAAPAPGLIAIAGDLRTNLVPKVYEVDTHTGARVNLASPAGDWDPAVSPDGSSLAYASARDGYAALYVAGADGSRPRRVTAPIEGTSFFGGRTPCLGTPSRPVWSPDGRRIAFEVTFDMYCTPPTTPARRSTAAARYTVSVAHRLAIVDADGSGLRILALDGFSPRWSPDGTAIAYVERSFLTLAATAGKTSGVLDVASGATRSLGSGAEPLWSLDGLRLALPTRIGTVRVFDRTGLRLQTLNGRGAGWTQCGLVTSAAGAVAVSPDARTAARRTATGIVVRACGGRDRLLVRGGYEPLSFSPNGARLLVGRCTTDACELAVAAGRRLVPIGPEDALRESPVWKPTGSEVAFLVAGGGVAVANATTGRVRMLSSEGTDSLLSGPVWTSDRTIVYGSLAPSLELNVYTLDPGSGAVHLVARDASRPAWSPDGRTVAYVTYAGPPGIWLADAAGRNKRLLVRANVDGLAWSPDGTRIAFSTGRTIEVARLGGGRLQRVLGPTAQATVEAWSPDGSWIAYTGRAAPLSETGTWLVHPDGGDNHLLVPGAWAFAWSPDGTRFAYTQPSDSGVWVADASGATAVRMPGVFSSTCLAWSQDARLLVARATPHGAAPGTLYRLVSLAPDGSGETPLTTDSVTVTEAAWQPRR